ETSVPVDIEHRRHPAGWLCDAMRVRQAGSLWTNATRASLGRRRVLESGEAAIPTCGPEYQPQTCRVNDAREQNFPRVLDGARHGIPEAGPDQLRRRGH